jgi:hypothetical protein
LAWTLEDKTRAGGVVEDYLTIAELSARLKIKPKTIKDKMAAGIFRRGVHFFSPVGLGPRFKWSAVVAWLEQSQEPPTETNDDSIPMPQNNRLRKAFPKKISIAS